MTRAFSTLCLAALAAAPLSTLAATTPLGTFDAPALLTLGDSHVRGLPFEDVYTFSLAAGSTFTFDAQFDVGDRRTWSDDLDAKLYRGDTLLQDGFDRDVPAGPGVPAPDARFVDFTPQSLGAGDYRLVVTGTIDTAFESIPQGPYDGWLSLSVAAPVPEPATWGLMALGLVGVAAARRRGTSSEG